MTKRSCLIAAGAVVVVAIIVFAVLNQILPYSVLENEKADLVRERMEQLEMGEIENIYLADELFDGSVHIQLWRLVIEKSEYNQIIVWKRGLNQKYRVFYETLIAQAAIEDQTLSFGFQTALYHYSCSANSRFEIMPPVKTLGLSRSWRFGLITVLGTGYAIVIRITRKKRR